MGIFYNPPPPPTASSAGTAPEPHVPIAAQGDLPPFRVAGVLAMVAVLASWPADLEPRLSKPNDQQQKIAPLTLTYGQQPPIAGTAGTTEYALIAAQWSTVPELRISAPRPPIAPLISADRPPPVGIGVPEFYQLAVSAWPADLEPRLGPPNNARRTIAPLTLAYGNQPSPTSALNTAEFTAISAWPQPEWNAQSAPRSTAWIAPPSSIPCVPFPYGLVLSNWPADLEPRLTRPNDQPQKIAPLTLPTGTSPQPKPPLALTTLTAIVSTWPTAWDAQTAPKNAAWNVPPVLVQVANATLPRAIWTAWEPPWVSPPSPVAIAPLTLPTGQAPPPQRQPAGVILAWPTDPPTVQRAVSVAAVLPPVGPVAYAPLPALIWTAWVEPFVRPRPLIAVAPLTLPTGQPPVPQSGLSASELAQIVGTWPLSPPSQHWFPRRVWVTEGSTSVPPAPARFLKVPATHRLIASPGKTRTIRVPSTNRSIPTGDT